MDCCPVVVSDLPVMCSRIDGVVTVVKAEQPNSTYHDLYWGKFLPVHDSLDCSDGSTATTKEDNQMAHLVVILHVMSKRYFVGEPKNSPLI